MKHLQPLAGVFCRVFDFMHPRLRRGCLEAITFECMATPTHFRDRNTGGEQT